MMFFSLHILSIFQITILISNHFAVKANTVSYTSPAAYLNQSNLAPLRQNATSTTSCVQCAMFLDAGVIEHFWWRTPLPLTLETIQFNVTKYNNSGQAAITNQKTIYEQALTAYDDGRSDIEGPLALADNEAISKVIDLFGPGYGRALFLNKDEDVITDENGFIMQVGTSPTPYNAYTYFQYYTPDPGECLTPASAYGSTVYIGDPVSLYPTISLSTIFYQTASGGALDLLNLEGKRLGDIGYQSFPSDFYNYIMSNSALIKSYPFLKTCQTALAHGAPSIKIPVSTLTTSEYNTFISAGIYTTNSAKATSISKEQPAPGSTAHEPTTALEPTKVTSSPSLVPDISQESQPIIRISNAPAVSNNPKDISDIEPAQSPENPQSQQQPNKSVNLQSDDSNPPADSQVPALSNIQPEVSIGKQSEKPNPKTRPTENISIEKQEPTKVVKAPPPIITIEKSSYTANSQSEYLIGSTKLVPGGPSITVNKVPYSLDNSIKILVAGSKTIVLKSTDTPDRSTPIITAGNQKFTANAVPQYIVGSQTLAPGGSVISINNVEYSLAPSATALVSAGSTVPLVIHSNLAPPLIIGGTKVTPIAALNYIIGTQTLVPGNPVADINGVSYSLAPSATALVYDGSTVQLVAGKYEPSILNIAGVAVTANSALNYVVGKQTLVPGGHPITVAGAVYSLPPSATALISNDVVIPILSENFALLPAIIIEATAYHENSASGFVIGSQTLVPEGNPITVDGAVYSLAPSAAALISNGVTVPIPSESPALPPAIIIEGTAYHENSASEFVIDSQTLVPEGNPITVDGAVYSLAPSATVLISNGVTVPILSESPTLPPAIIIEGTAYHENSASEVIIGSQTLVPGANSITINGAVYALAPSATALISNGFTIPILAHASLVPSAISIGGSVFPINSASEYLIGSQTLVFNGNPITINATPYSLSLGPAGEALIIGDSTSYLSAPQATRSPAVITIGSSLYTENQASDYVIGGQTLSPGSKITLAGTVISLGPQGTDVVIGTKTEEVDLGSLILNGFRGPPTGSAGGGSNDSTVERFTGRAGKREIQMGVVWVMMVLSTAAVRIIMVI